jgi:putative NADH-flavin reductase
MKTALMDATGRVGSRLATELIYRGHLVSGIALHVPNSVHFHFRSCRRT